MTCRNSNQLLLYATNQTSVDATLVSPVGRDGLPRRRADTHPGATVQEAARRKRTQTYPEFYNSPRCRFAVFGLEIGGRSSTEAVTLIRQLALAKARNTPRWARQQAARAWGSRWASLAAVAAARAHAASLLELPLHGEEAMDGPPSLPTLLADARWEDPPVPSRLPP